MWNLDSRRIFPEQVDGIAGQTDSIHPMLQAVLIQAHNRLILFTGKGLNPVLCQNSIQWNLLVW